MLTLSANNIMIDKCPEYVAPEVQFEEFQGKTNTLMEADWYSFGMIIYVMLHGYPPWVRNGRNDMKRFL